MSATYQKYSGVFGLEFVTWRQMQLHLAGGALVLLLIYVRMTQYRDFIGFDNQLLIQDWPFWHITQKRLLSTF